MKGAREVLKPMLFGWFDVCVWLVLLFCCFVFFFELVFGRCSYLGTLSIWSTTALLLKYLEDTQPFWLILASSISVTFGNTFHHQPCACAWQPDGAIH